MLSAKLSLFLSLLSLLVTSAHAIVLNTSSRWIVNAANGQRVKLRCVNWAGHQETNIPEGLQHQPVATIAQWIANNRFNCVRLTFSIDMALNPNLAVSTSFTQAASPAGVTVAALQAVYNQAIASNKNPWLSSTTTRGAFARVIQDLNNVGVLVILDNHVSRASWCCGTSDGNGWWASASGYNANNSRYFDTNNWLAGLRAMATFAKSHPNVVGISIRNELRAVSGQDGNNHADWYNYVTQGGNAVRSANPDLLVVVGGVNYALDLSFIYNRPLDRGVFGNKLVMEYHNYAFSGIPRDCASHQSLMGNRAGFILVQNQPHTYPFFLSEFGLSQIGPSADEQGYLNCLVRYMENNDAEWAYWALQGSYYVRESRVNFDETFGLLNSNWSGWRNSTFQRALGRMMDVTQGP